MYKNSTSSRARARTLNIVRFIGVLLMQTIQAVKIKDFERYYKQGKSRVRWAAGDKTGYIYIGKVAAGFGERHYFICSKCGQYRQKLAFNGEKFACFGCFGINMYAGIQETTRGGWEFIMYKMHRFAEKNRMGDLKFPFTFYDCKRPARYNEYKWSKNLMILQALESMRNQCIFWERTFDPKIIQAVERGEHEAVQPPRYTPYYHLINFHPFDGKAIPSTYKI